MAINSIKFNGISTLGLGLVVQAGPTLVFPERDIEVTHVPGRNGDVVVSKSSFKNVTKSFSLAMIYTVEGNAIFPWDDSDEAEECKNSTDFLYRADQVIKWLIGSTTGGYKELWDTSEGRVTGYDSKFYRKAYFKDSGSLSDIYKQGTAIQVNFECKPQKYLCYGKDGIQSYGYGTSISKRSGGISLDAVYNISPKISVYQSSGLSGYTLYITSNDITTGVLCKFVIGSSTINPGTINEIIIDWENKSIYGTVTATGSTLVNLGDAVTIKDNNNVVLHDFPEMTTATNWKFFAVNSEGTIGSVTATITPYWWTM